VLAETRAASSIAGFYGNHAAEFMANVRTLERIPATGGE
jgi:hypothetical protein